MRRMMLMLLAVMAGFVAPAARAEEFTRAQIEQIVGEYIKAHPQEMIDSVENFGKQQQQQDDATASQKVRENIDWLTKNKDHAEAGNPKGDVTITEFFDYNCGYCKAALTDLMTLLDDDKNVRLVFVEIPILGESSDAAARWALAAKKQAKYLPYHIALMKHKGPLDEGVFVDYATKSGLDVNKLKTDRSDPDIQRVIDENLGMARKLGIQGTPAFVVGDQLVRGYVGMDGLKEAIAKARADKKK